MTREQLFWRWVDKTGDCWLWTGCKDRAGYGFGNQKHWPSRMAHRIAYELTVGPVPEGMELDHLCRVKACVNPDHLEPVTHAENMRRYRDATTHCASGHLYDEANTLLDPRGYKRCRACARERSRLRQGYYERVSA